MKRGKILTLLCVIGICWFAPQQSFAQTGATSAQRKPTQEEIIQEILREVRQLREEVQRLRASSSQTQVLVEQLRLQQDQVTRLTREIGEIRERISDTKIRQVKITGMVEEIEKQVKVGVIPPSELKKINGEIEELQQREKRLTEQDSQLSAELESERLKLITLNKRLEELGRER